MSKLGQKLTATLDDVADAIRNVGYCDTTGELDTISTQVAKCACSLENIASALEGVAREMRDGRAADERTSHPFAEEFL